MLFESNHLSKQKLAEKLECSVKTIERTIRVLELAGISVFLDSKTKSYRLQDGYVVPLVRLSAEECLDEVRDLAVGQGHSVQRPDSAACDSSRPKLFYNRACARPSKQHLR
jgi:predicted DNA-binding transcriptional regulator YafY